MSTEQGTTVHERLLRPYLGHCSSAALAVRWMPSAACAATPPFHVRSSSLFCGRPGGLELVTRLPSRDPTRSVDSFCRDLKTFFSFLVLLTYTAHEGLRDYTLYKSTIDIGIDIWLTSVQ